jgi:hypothetical protein
VKPAPPSDTEAVTALLERPLSCPFCGAEPYVACCSKYFVCCGSRGCESWGPVRETPAEAIAAWNRRTPTAAADRAAKLVPFLKAGLDTMGLLLSHARGDAEMLILGLRAGGRFHTTVDELVALNEALKDPDHG